MPVTEEQVRDATIEELKNAPNNTLTTTELIEILSDKMALDHIDLEILNNRDDTRFSQIVRNLVSHRSQSNGLEASGVASYDPDNHSWTLIC